MTEAPPTIRSVAVPTEHGGWSLTLEPVLLGLLVQPSLSGAALGAVALLGFLVRTPLKTALVDRYRGRRLDRTGLAWRVAASELALVAAALGVSIASAVAAFWWPLVLAAPLIGVELWYDVRSRSRRLVPEVAGTVGVASIAAAIALAGGAGAPVAYGLWSVAAARAIATVPFVRVQLRRAKQQPHRLLSSDGAQLVAVVIVATGVVVDAVPIGAALSIAILGAVQSWLVRRTPPATPVLGAQQVVLGLFVVLTSGLAFLAP